MAEPFKTIFNPGMIRQMGAHLKRSDSSFDSERFVELATDKLETLEMKQRSDQICHALTATLPDDFQMACNILTRSLHPDKSRVLSNTSMDETGISGWAIVPMADYVAARGADSTSGENFDFALDILAELTMRFSSEFAIRHFFIADPQRTMKKAMFWANDKNEHVRRLASEGSRPRLPWGLRLTKFTDDPSSLLPLLERLKDDPSEYVRRSVANNINDIAKDHPDLVARLAEDWLHRASDNRKKLVKHACRTLIKQGHRPTLAALGYGKPEVTVENLKVKTPVVKLGEAVEFSFDLTSNSNVSQPLILDFIIHHQKANGKTSPKTFKWKAFNLPPEKTQTLFKKHSMKPVTTRIYYTGTHGLEIQINGESFGEIPFEFIAG